MSQRSRFFDSAGTAITLATSAAADDIIDTATPHGFVAGQAVHFTALTGGSGLTVGTIYWVVSTSLGANTFRIAASQGGVALGFTTDITAGTVVGADRVYTSEAWAQVISGIVSDGVVKGSGGGDELQVTENSPAAMSVLVGLGKVFIQGYMLEVYSADEPLTISAAHASNPRIDRIVARRDLTGRTATLAVLAGTPAASPTAPALTQNVSGTWEVSLAQVLVPAASTSVINARITDERSYSTVPAIDVITDGSTGHTHDGTDGDGPNIPWANVSSKPTTFAPADHTHAGTGTGGQVAWANISSKPSTFQAADHTHASSGTQAGTVAHSVLTGVSADQHHNKSHTHDGADGSGSVAWGSVTGKPSTFTPASHTLDSHTGTLDSIGGWEQASQGGGAAGTKIWVGTTSPSGPSEGDIWVKG